MHHSLKESFRRNTRPQREDNGSNDSSMEYPITMAASVPHQFVINDVHDVNEVPMSRTHQYRKVMKPLLERKRRARINRCLDELKDLMVLALQMEGESITKLEKADVLELTVRHLQKLKQHNILQADPASVGADRYQAGFTACAGEVSKFLSSVPGVDITIGAGIMSHLGSKSSEISRRAAALSSPLTVSVPLPSTSSSIKATSAASATSSDGGYSSGRDSVSPRSSSGSSSAASPPPPLSEALNLKKSDVWRPF